MLGPSFSHCLDHTNASATEQDVAAQRQQVRSISECGATSRGVSHLEQPVTAQSVHHIPQVAFLALQEIRQGRWAAQRLHLSVHQQHACTCTYQCTAALHIHCATVYGSTCNMPAYVFNSTWQHLQHACTCAHQCVAQHAACPHTCSWQHAQHVCTCGNASGCIWVYANIMQPAHLSDHQQHATGVQQYTVARAARLHMCESVYGNTLQPFCDLLKLVLTTADTCKLHLQSTTCTLLSAAEANTRLDVQHMSDVVMPSIRVAASKPR